MIIGSYKLSTPIALSPMTGITDNPFRKICRSFGASWTVGEMISGNPTFRQTHKTLHRVNYSGEDMPIVVQIVGNDPKQLAESALYNVKLGANIVDINMGCPAKKVCQSYAGSALMKNEPLVQEILETVVSAVDVPVTLKTRLGWDDEHLNVLNIAKIAEKAGIKALSIHGRSRTQKFNGNATYDLIKQVKEEVDLPLWVNGDITSAQKAKDILEFTGADGVMIGRGAQGKPWLFRDIKYYLETGKLPEVLPYTEVKKTILRHIKLLHHFYGSGYGCRIARKHINWYLNLYSDWKTKREVFNAINIEEMQLNLIESFLTDHKKEDEYYLHATKKI